MSPADDVPEGLAAQLDQLEVRIDAWLDELDGAYDHIVAIDRGEDDAVRWFIRMRGEAKDFIVVWLTAGQRTLRYETYVMPAPIDNIEAFYRHLLVRNDRLVGVHFSIGDEDAVYLRGEMAAATVTKDDVDRILGTIYATVEATFDSLLRLGYARRFNTDS